LLDIIFIILFFLTILFMYWGMNDRNIAFTILSAILWIILALFMLQGIETSYQTFNATSGNIETGTQIIQTNLDPLAYLFMGIGSIMFILTITFMLEWLTDYKKIKKY